jgi:hypothetical protein
VARQKRIFREWQHPRDARGRFATKGSAAWATRAFKAVEAAAGRGEVKGLSAASFSMAAGGGQQERMGAFSRTFTAPTTRRPSTFELGSKSKSASGPEAAPLKKLAAPGARKPRTAAVDTPRDSGQAGGMSTTTPAAELKPNTEAYRRAAGKVAIRASGPGMTPTLDRRPQPGDLVFSGGLNRAGTVVREIKRNRSNGFDVQWEGEPYTRHTPDYINLHVVDVPEALRRQEAASAPETSGTTKTYGGQETHLTTNPWAEALKLPTKTLSDKGGRSRDETAEERAATAARTSRATTGAEGAARNGRESWGTLLDQKGKPSTTRGRVGADTKRTAMQQAADRIAEQRSLPKSNRTPLNPNSRKAADIQAVLDALPADLEIDDQTRSTYITKFRGTWSAVMERDNGKVTGLFDAKSKREVMERIIDAQQGRNWMKEFDAARARGEATPPERGLGFAASDRMMASLTDEQIRNGLVMYGNQTVKGKRLQAEADRRAAAAAPTDNLGLADEPSEMDIIKGMRKDVEASKAAGTNPATAYHSMNRGTLLALARDAKISVRGKSNEQIADALAAKDAEQRAARAPKVPAGATTSTQHAQHTVRAAAPREQSMAGIYGQHAGLTREQFDALPEAERERVLADLRKVRDANEGGIRGLRSSRFIGSKGWVAEEHTTGAQNKLRELTRVLPNRDDYTVEGRARRAAAGDVNAIDGTMEELQAIASANKWGYVQAWKKPKAVDYLRNFATAHDTLPDSWTPEGIAEALPGVDSRKALAVLDIMDAGNGLTLANLDTIARHLGVPKPVGRDKRAKMHDLAAKAKEAARPKADAAPAKNDDGGMSDAEINDYMRSKGLYPDEYSAEANREWMQRHEAAFGPVRKQAQNDASKLVEQLQKRLRGLELERESADLYGDTTGGDEDERDRAKKAQRKELDDLRAQLLEAERAERGFDKAPSKAFARLSDAALEREIKAARPGTKKLQDLRDERDARAAARFKGARPKADAAQVAAAETPKAPTVWIDKATGRVVTNPGQVGIVRGDIVKADSDAGRAAVARRQAGVDTRRDKSQNGGVSNAPTTEATMTKPARDSRPRSELSYARDSLLRTAAVIRERIGEQPEYTAGDPDKTEVNAATAWSTQAYAIARELGTKNPYEAGAITGELQRAGYLTAYRQGPGNRVHGQGLTDKGLRHVAETAPTPKGGGRTGAEKARIDAQAAQAEAAAVATAGRAANGYTGAISTDRAERLNDKAFTDHVKMLTLVANTRDEAEAWGFERSDQPVKVGDEVVTHAFDRFRRGIVTSAPRGGLGNIRIAYVTPSGGYVQETTTPHAYVLQLVDPAKRPETNRAALLPKITPEARPRPTAEDRAATREAKKAADKAASAARTQKFFDDKIKGITASLNGENGNTPEWHLQMTTEQGLVSLAKHLGVKVANRRQNSLYGGPMPRDRDEVDKIRQDIVAAVRARQAASTPKAPAAPAGDSTARHTTAPVSVDIFENGAGQLDVGPVNGRTVYDVSRQGGTWNAEHLQGPAVGGTSHRAATLPDLARKVATAHGVSGRVSIEDEREKGRSLTQRFEHTTKAASAPVRSLDATKVKRGDRVDVGGQSGEVLAPPASQPGLGVVARVGFTDGRKEWVPVDRITGHTPATPDTSAARPTRTPGNVQFAVPPSVWDDAFDPGNTGVPSERGWPTAVRSGGSYHFDVTPRQAEQMAAHLERRADILAGDSLGGTDPAVLAQGRRMRDAAQALRGQLGRSPNAVPLGSTDAQREAFAPRLEGESDLAYQVRTVPEEDTARRVLDGYSTAGLRAIARDNNVPVRSGATKPQLVEALLDQLRRRWRDSQAMSRR